MGGGGFGGRGGNKGPKKPRSKAVTYCPVHYPFAAVAARKGTRASRRGKAPSAAQRFGRQRDVGARGRRGVRAVRDGGVLLPRLARPHQDAVAVGEDFARRAAARGGRARARVYTRRAQVSAAPGSRGERADGRAGDGDARVGRGGVPRVLASRVGRGPRGRGRERAEAVIKRAEALHKRRVEEARRRAGANDRGWRARRARSRAGGSRRAKPPRGSCTAASPRRSFAGKAERGKGSRSNTSRSSNRSSG